MEKSSILTVGSLAFDSIETPSGQVSRCLGGSVNYFSLSASFFAPVLCVSIVGKDFPESHLSTLQEKGISTDGIKIVDGKTFYWSGKYSENLNDCKTLKTELNVFENFSPALPKSYKNAKFIFLGNISPELQLSVLEQVSNPQFIAIDTMNYWIERSKEALLKVLSKSDCIIINETELKLLTQKNNIFNGINIVHDMGPKIALIKRGEYGSVLTTKSDIFAIPAFPLKHVKDPTGAGDSFAGGFMGYLASQPQPRNFSTLKKALIYGTVMASFTVEEFSINALLNATKEAITNRYHKLISIISID